MDKKLLETKAKIRVDLGCGQNKEEGFVGIDYEPYKGVDIVHDLETFPWPLPDDCANLIVASHIVEHINPHKGVFLKFMDEAWRILEPGGKMLISTPYAGSTGYFQDPTHCNPCNHATWAYFDPFHRSELYKVYHPKPWEIVDCFWADHGNMEVVLKKRRWDKSYGE